MDFAHWWKILGKKQDKNIDRHGTPFDVFGLKKMEMADSDFYLWS